MSTAADPTPSAAATAPAEASAPRADPEAPLEAEEFDDHDSVISSLGEQISTASLRSSINEYRMLNGRGYHRENDRYFLPIDEHETDRLDLQNHHFLLTLGGKTHLSPGAATAQRVLDVGTGTGIWAIEFADDHPQAEVIGVDVAAMQPTFVPPNCRFEVDDVEKDWTWGKKFDYIFIRMMVGSLGDWDKLIKQAWDNLEPGGWIEHIDPIMPAVSDDGTLPADSALSKYDKYIMDAGDGWGRSFAASQHHEERLKKQGFVNVQRRNFKWPTNTWPKDKQWKEVGLWTLANIEGNLEGISMALMTQGIGMTQEEALAFLASVRKEMRNPRIHAYWPVINVVGQKPPAEAET